jgi:hypothetical protein
MSVADDAVLLLHNDLVEDVDHHDLPRRPGEDLLLHVNVLRNLLHLLRRTLRLLHPPPPPR